MLSERLQRVSTVFGSSPWHAMETYPPRRCVLRAEKPAANHHCPGKHPQTGLASTPWIMQNPGWYMRPACFLEYPAQDKASKRVGTSILDPMQRGRPSVLLTEHPLDTFVHVQRITEGKRTDVSLTQHAWLKKCAS